MTERNFEEAFPENVDVSGEIPIAIKKQIKEAFNLPTDDCDIILKLYEENEQLKQQLENEKQLNAEIKKRLVEVEYDSNDLLKQKYEENKQLAKRICELQSDLSKAKSMIEKMKRCQNCKNYYNKTKGGADYCLFLHTCTNYDKWELDE